jgi:phage terminase small subunit
VEEYVVDLNATAAAQRPGYSPRRSSEIGCQLLRKTQVITAVAKAITARSQRIELTQDEVIAGLRREALRVGRDSQHSARVKALEILAKMGGFLPDSHLHRHQQQQELPMSPSKITISSQEVIDKLPLETRLQILEAVRAAQEEAKAVAKLTHSAQPVEPNGEPSYSAPIEPTALVIDTTAQVRKPIPERREQSR